MNEVFRFMTVRSPHLVDSSSAIDLSSLIQPPQPAPAARVAQQAPNLPILAAAGPPVNPATLNYAQGYASLAAALAAPDFVPTATLDLVAQATGANNLANLNLANFVASGNYQNDKRAAAIALVAAHLNPPADGRIRTLATYVRMMSFLDDLAANLVPMTSLSIRAYLAKIITVPPGTFGPPYNPFVVPAGVADLLVVNQELLAYDRQEISYIANVLQTESYKRVTVRFERTDQTFTTTTDTTTQTEQDTQSSQRFQVQTQAQNTINSDASMKFGVSISASSGPSVQAKTNFDASSDNSQSTANNVSSYLCEGRNHAVGE